MSGHERHIAPREISTAVERERGWYPTARRGSLATAKTRPAACKRAGCTENRCSFEPLAFHGHDLAEFMSACGAARERPARTRGNGDTRSAGMVSLEAGRPRGNSDTRPGLGSSSARRYERLSGIVHNGIPRLRLTPDERRTVLLTEGHPGACAAREAGERLFEFRKDIDRYVCERKALESASPTF